ncbi:hypothetical protein RB598_004440 [Gaeumannomyces tritici]
MLCAISGEAPQEPVVSKKSGHVYEKRLIEKYIDEHGKEPGTDEDLDKEDLLDVRSSRVVRPRPATLTSIPALLATFQSEWDSLALETYNLQQQLSRTREELAHALYQHDAAVRVIARLTQERNQARDALARVTISAPAPAAANGAADSAMAIDAEMPQEVLDHVDETAQLLSKSRKKRPVPPTWASPDDIVALDKVASDPLQVSQATSVGVGGGYAAVGALSGDLAVYSLEGKKVERTIPVGEPITDVIWTDSKVVLGTAKGTVKIIDSGSEVASFADHAGGVTAVALHPGGDIVASVGADRGIVLYQLSTLKKIFQASTDSGKSLSLVNTSRFHLLTSPLLPYSSHNLRLPPRRCPPRRRYRLGRYQALPHQDPRGGRVLLPRRTHRGHHLLRERLLVRRRGQVADHRHRLRPAQVGRRRPGQDARDRRHRLGPGLGLHGPLPGLGRSLGRLGSGLQQELQGVDGAVAQGRGGRRRPGLGPRRQDPCDCQGRWCCGAVWPARR